MSSIPEEQNHASEFRPSESASVSWGNAPLSPSSGQPQQPGNPGDGVHPSPIAAAAASAATPTSTSSGWASFLEPDPADLPGGTLSGLAPTGLEELDRQLQARFDQVRPSPEWSPLQASNFITEFVDVLVESFVSREDIPPQLEEQYFARLRQTLERAGHHKPTQSDLRSRFRCQARLIAGEESRLVSFGGNRAGSSSGVAAYFVLDGSQPGTPEDPDRWGIYASHGDHPTQITNFTARILNDVRVHDELSPRRIFEGEINLRGQFSQFVIDAHAFANNERLLAAIYDAAGPSAQVYCRPNELRTAISSLSAPVQRQTTTTFGWTADGNAYLFPSGRITSTGYAPATAQDETRVELSAEQHARYLDLRWISPGLLAQVKQHIVQDLLQLNDRSVTYVLLAVTALAPLWHFCGNGFGQFGLWLVGLTGSGKTYLVWLFLQFFGAFPREGGFPPWTATPNFIERQGYFFANALYLVDDNKPELVNQKHVQRITQNYADGSGRGRLRSDATSNVTRYIRGRLISTGEDGPPRAASANARSVIVPVANHSKDLDRGERCERASAYYSGFTAALIHWLIAHRRTDAFAARVNAYRRAYCQPVAGRQNDARIANNFATLAAGFEQIAEFLADAWPTWQSEVEWFTATYLPSLRDEMIGRAADAQESTTILELLRDLYAYGRVAIQDYPVPDLRGDDGRPLIGRAVLSNTRQRGAPANPVPSTNGRPEVIELSSSMVLEVVNDSLRRQAKQEVKLSAKALLAQLHSDGLLVDEHGVPLPRDASHLTHAISLGQGTTRVFRILASSLFPGQFRAAADGGAAAPRGTGLDGETAPSPNGAAGNGRGGV